MSAFMLYCTSLMPISALAQAIPVPPDPERQGIADIRDREDADLKRQATTEADAGGHLPDMQLSAPVTELAVEATAPIPEDKIVAVLRPFLGHVRLDGAELAEARGAIWSMLRRRGHLARIELTATTLPGGGSRLQAVVHDIRVQSVFAEEEGLGGIDPATLRSIETEAKDIVGADERGGSVPLDVAQLENHLRRRLYLRDVDLRATLVPVGPDIVDVKILAARKPLAPIGGVVQLDNSGLETYGRHRYTLGVSVPGRLAAGDRLDLLTINSSHMNFGRIEYDVPLLPLSARLDVSGAYVAYRTPTGEKGATWSVDAGLSYPVHLGDDSAIIGRLGYLHRQQADRLTGIGAISDKDIDALTATLDAKYYPGAAQTLYVTASLTLGDLDLGGLPSALAQDRISARTDGRFVKFAWRAGYSALFGPGGRFDVRLDTEGQIASRNLDQSEKFALGGPLALRAFGSAEGLGDEGVIAQAELGFRPVDWLRAFAFYGAGRTRRHDRPWVLEAIPVTYTLQAGGAGLSAAYGPLSASLTYARRIGDNPGLSASGLDSEGLRGRDRLWFTLTLRR